MDYRNHRYQQIDRCVFTLSSDTQTDTTTTTITVSDLKSIVVVYQAGLSLTALSANGNDRVSLSRITIERFYSVDEAEIDINYY